MTRPYRALSTTDNATAVAEPPVAATVEADYVVILAALLCALICVVGLISVARCAWLRRGSVATPNQLSENRGIKRKTIEVLPKLTYDADRDDKGCGRLSSRDCAICLAEYVHGDEIRVLPQCGHGFHVGCVDMWLRSHSSCPSCRQVLVARRCKKCGEVATVSGGNGRLEAEGKCKQHNSCGSGSSSSSNCLPCHV